MPMMLYKTVKLLIFSKIRQLMLLLTFVDGWLFMLLFSSAYIIKKGFGRWLMRGQLKTSKKINLIKSSTNYHRRNKSKTISQH